MVKMSNKTPQRIMRELGQPFTMKDLEWRVQQTGKSQNGYWARIIAYVTNRAIQNRLDDAVGAFNWKNEFAPLPNDVGGGAMCGISVKIGDEWITKWDGSENTQIEAIKGGLSGAMKRAAVHWNIGRYLYDVEAMYADCITEDDYKKLSPAEKDPYERASYKKGRDAQPEHFYWKPKKLADKFLPQKYVGANIVKEIKQLAEDTKTDLDAILDSYGVSDIRDLYGAEASEITLILAKRKARQAEDQKNEQA